MDVFVGLLRAVNLGARGRIAMARLRELTEAAGGHDARTYLNSGNVVFTAARADPAVHAAALRARLADDGLDVEVMMRAGEALVDLVEQGHPYASEEPVASSLQVAFPLEPVDAARVADVPTPGGERVAWRAGEVCVHYPNGVGRSKLTVASLQRHLGTPVTCRNWRTVTALADLVRQRG